MGSPNRLRYVLSNSSCVHFHSLELSKKIGMLTKVPWEDNNVPKYRRSSVTSRYRWHPCRYPERGYTTTFNNYFRKLIVMIWIEEKLEEDWRLYIVTTIIGIIILLKHSILDPSINHEWKIETEFQPHLESPPLTRFSHLGKSYRPPVHRVQAWSIQMWTALAFPKLINLCRIILMEIRSYVRISGST